MQEPTSHHSHVTFPAPVNDQWDYLLSTIWSQMLHLVITLNGQLEPKRLGQAMSLVVEAEPLLASRFVESSTPFWEKIPALPRDLIFSFVRCDDSDSALQQVMTARIDPAEGPQARLSLIRGQEDRLVLSVNHAVTDAYGVKHISRLLGLAYRSLDSDPGFSLPPYLHKDRSFYPIISAFTPHTLAAARETCGEQSAVWGISPHMGSSNSPAYRSRIIEPHLFHRMKEYTHTHGLTINDLLLAAFFAALYPEIPNPLGVHYPILTSVDLRRSLPHYEAPSVANLSVAFEVWLPVQSPLQFPWLVGEVHHAMSDKKGLFAGIGSAIRLQEDFSGGFYSVRERLQDLKRRTYDEHHPKNPFFSNTGIISPDCVDFGDISTVHAFIGPPVDYPPGFGITASTYQNRLTLASGFCGNSVPHILVERVLSRMEDHLSTLTTG